MLAQILPGFRDFRTPLVAGYLWLLSTWILLGKPVPTKDRKDGLMGTVNALSEYLSPALVLGALSFVAYVVGILLAVDIKFVSKMMQISGGMKTEASRSTSSTGIMARLLWDALRRLEKRLVPMSMVYQEFDITYSSSDKGNDIETIENFLLARMRAEIPTLATKLQEKNKDLYDSYSRDKSEAEFRLSVALPIGIAAVLSYTVGLFINSTLNLYVAAAGFLAAVVLFYKGWKKSQEATNIVFTALEIDVIQSKILERLDALQGPEMRKTVDGETVL